MDPHRLSFAEMLSTASFSRRLEVAADAPNSALGEWDYEIGWLGENDRRVAVFFMICAIIIVVLVVHHAFE